MYVLKKLNLFILSCKTSHKENTKKWSTKILLLLDVILNVQQNAFYKTIIVSKPHG